MIHQLRRAIKLSSRQSSTMDQKDRLQIGTEWKSQVPTATLCTEFLKENNHSSRTAKSTPQGFVRNYFLKLWSGQPPIQFWLHVWHPAFHPWIKARLSNVWSNNHSCTCLHVQVHRSFVFCTNTCVEVLRKRGGMPSIGTSKRQQQKNVTRRSRVQLHTDTKGFLTHPEFPVSKILQMININPHSPDTNLFKNKLAAASN